MKSFLIAALGIWSSPARCEVTTEALTVGLFQEACLQRDYEFLRKDLLSPIRGAVRSIATEEQLVEDEALYGASWEMSLGGIPVWLSTQVVTDDDFVIGECKVVVALKLDEQNLMDAFVQLLKTEGPITDEIERGARFVAYRVEYDDIVFATYLNIVRVDDGSVTLVSARRVADIVHR